jgi:hypothetical protein
VVLVLMLRLAWMCAGGESLSIQGCMSSSLGKSLLRTRFSIAQQCNVHFLTIAMCVQDVSSSQSANVFSEFDVVVFLPCLSCACCAQVCEILGI